MFEITGPINEWFATAAEHHQSGRFIEAGFSYSQILRKNPRHADSLHRLGLLSFQAGNLSQASTMITRAIAVDRRNPAYHSDLGDVLQAQRYAKQAIVHYRTALKLQPALVHTLNNLGLAQLKTGALDAALNSFDRALALRPDIAELYCRKGDVLGLKGQLAVAVSCYERAIELKPGLVAAHDGLGTVFEAQGRLDDAASQYQQVRLCRPMWAQGCSKLGNVLRAQGRLHAALEQYADALRLDPINAEVRKNLAETLARLRELDEAVTRHKAAMTLAAAPSGLYAHVA